MENNEKEREIMTTEEDMDKNDTANNKNKKYDESRIYYVYKHVRLDNNTCFYIGKGKDGRKNDPNRNPTHDSICKRHEYKVVIFKDKLNEAEAFKLEEDLIRCYVFKMGYGICIKGHMNNNNKFLTNKTWGGEGVTGYKFSEEAKQKKSEKMKGKNNPMYGKNAYANKTEEEMEVIGEKISKKLKGKKRSEETKRKISKGNKGKNAGKNHPLYGKHHSQETKMKMSKKVICITTGVIFYSQTEAAIHYNIPRSSISDCCNGKRKSAGKLNGERLKWMYLEDYNNEFKGI